MTNKAKNRITTPFTQTFGTMNVNDGISDHMITSHSTATGDFEAKVVGIVLASSDGSEHIQVGGFSVSTKPDFYPSSNPLGYICILTSRVNAVGMKDPIMEPFADMPLPNSSTYKNCLRALFPKYFFKLRSGHTYEPVYVGSPVVVGYTNNEIGGPGHFIRSLDMQAALPIMSNQSSIQSSMAAYHGAGANTFIGGSSTGSHIIGEYIAGPSTTKIAAVGDSITVGVGAGNKSYVDYLGGKKFAIGGKASYSLKGEFNKAMSTSPEYIIIFMGVNNPFSYHGCNSNPDVWAKTGKRGVISNLQEMYSHAKSKGVKVVGVTLIPPIKTLNKHINKCAKNPKAFGCCPDNSRRSPSKVVPKLQEINSWIMQNADIGINNSDMWDSNGILKQFDADGIHLNKAGQIHLANKIKAKIGN